VMSPAVTGFAGLLASSWKRYAVAKSSAGL
jgi:hypothetical protein